MKVQWRCLDCGWPWPLAGEPPEDAECDNCGGELGPDTLTETTTVPVLDLVGQPVVGIRAQVRHVYDFPGWAPMWRTLRGVRRYIDGEGEWVEWTWEPESSDGKFDCGYSAVTVDLAVKEGRTLELVGWEQAS